MIRLFRVLGKRGRITIPFEIRHSESDSNTTMFYHSPIRMTVRYLSGEKNSATTAMNLQKNMRKITPLKISSTACPRKNRKMHFYIFPCCGQKSRMLVYRLRMPKRNDYQLVFKNLWTFQNLWIYLLLKGRR